MKISMKMKSQASAQEVLQTLLPDKNSVHRKGYQQSLDKRSNKVRVPARFTMCPATSVKQSGAQKLQHKAPLFRRVVWT